LSTTGSGVPHSQTIREILGQAPEDFRDHFRTAYANLAKLDPKSWGDVISIAQGSWTPVLELELEKTAANLGMRKEELRSVANATFLFMYLLLCPNEGPADFVAAAVELGLLEERDAQQIGQIAESALQIWNTKI